MVLGWALPLGWSEYSLFNFSKLGAKKLLDQPHLLLKLRLEQNIVQTSASLETPGFSFSVSDFTTAKMGFTDLLSDAGLTGKS